MKIAVIYGGTSAEREVSLNSGRAILQALSSYGYEVCGMDVDQTLFDELKRYQPDLVFLGLHGRLGEDGAIQGALEILGIPYVGSAVLSSALAMDKVMTKRILRPLGIPLADDRVYVSHRAPEEDEVERMMDDILSHLTLPVIVKPNREGSTFGLTLATTESLLKQGIRQAFAHDDSILVESYIRGMEVTVVVVGTARDAQNPPRVLGTIEIIPKAEVYDYESKYGMNGSEHIIPARLPEELLSQVETYALTAYTELGCRDYGRVDFMVGENGPVLLEVNTLPGMTATSLVPDAARAAGLSFEALIDQLVSQAYQRAHP
ncbi:D-alanine--D-alanine ligase [Ferroacidibacillus organovorans]|uniref:D-alanine--D-alanine ligase n=1 Tax=Ferroacidibacillus organovorans TaxID=1765683 RepID=A0A1V4EUI5_9BACL|nr:D-alanine--D-alanine ligase [Ferroacidibacillus organovorans]OPG16579.1 hypothetical protein B2M26_06880 [Ferroacidibacillus organovorans]